MRRLILCLLVFILVAPAVYAASPLLEPDGAWTTVRGSTRLDSSVRHEGKKSLRVEPSAVDPDAAVRSAPINLTIGKTYELTGWVRTEDLTVRDLDRSPIASGAALTMASMPYDVHSASLGGTREWTRLSLRFVATRAQDLIPGAAALLKGRPGSKA